MISPSQRPLPDNTQHSQQTNIHAPGGIRTHNLNRRAAKDLRLRPRSHWDYMIVTFINFFPFAPKHADYCKGRCFAIQLHCATKRKVAGSIPDGVTGIFHWLIPSDRTRPPIEMITRFIASGWECGSKGVLGLTILPHSHADCLEILGVLSYWSPKYL